MSLAARPVQNINPYGRPKEGIAYPEHLAPAVSLDSIFSTGMLQAKPLPTLVHKISLVARPQVKFRTSHWKTVTNPVMDINTECLHVRRFPYPALLEQSVLGVSPEIRMDQTDGLQCPSWTTQLHCEQSGLQSSARTLSKKESVDNYDSPDRLQTEISATSTEMTGGSPPADIDICDGPDRLQTEISATSTKMTGGSPPAHIDICEGPDRLQTEVSVTSMEMAGGSPPALIDIGEGPDRLQTEISMTFHVNDDMNTDLSESSAPMLRSPTIFKRPCVVSSALPTLNQIIVNQPDVTMDMDAEPPESSALMINSDLMVLWPAKIRRPGWA